MAQNFPKSWIGAGIDINGAGIGVIAAQLGHADTRMTEKRYAHLSPSCVAQTIRANFPNLGIVRSVIEYYNHHRYHESLENLTPADVYFGRGQAILRERHRIKQKTIEHRRSLHRMLVA